MSIIKDQVTRRWHQLGPAPAPDTWSFLQLKASEKEKKTENRKD